MYRVDERNVDVSSGHSHHLLRGRNRDGRQCQPRRPRWRANSNAMEWRMERGLFQRRPRKSVCAVNPEPNLWVPGDQYSVAAQDTAFAFLLDAADDCGSAIGQSIRLW